MADTVSDLSFNDPKPGAFTESMDIAPTEGAVAGRVVVPFRRTIACTIESGMRTRPDLGSIQPRRLNSACPCRRRSSSSRVDERGVPRPIELGGVAADI